MQDFLFYLSLGWEHIISWDALDHQLFILALIAVFDFRDWKKILILVTAFTIGHSITLILSALDIVRLPYKWVEFLIPLSIAVTAADNLISRNNPQKLMRLNYYLALIFGLIHGLGFANTARMMISSEQNLAIPLLGFNIGLELGQIVVVAVILLIFYFLSRFLKLQKKHWMVGVSVIALIWSLQISLGRIPL